MICYIIKTFVTPNKFPHVKVAGNTKKAGQAWARSLLQTSTQRKVEQYGLTATVTEVHLKNTKRQNIKKKFLSVTHWKLTKKAQILQNGQMCCFMTSTRQKWLNLHLYGSL